MQFHFRGVISYASGGKNFLKLPCSHAFAVVNLLELAISAFM